MEATSAFDLVCMPDDVQTDTGTVACYSFDGNAAFSSGQFVIVRCHRSGRSYLGQIDSPQLNFNRDALRPLDNTTANQMEALRDGRISDDAIIKEVFYYIVNLLKDITTGRPESVRRRPQIGAIARLATEAEAIEYLGLPESTEDTRIGSVIDTDISICVDQRTIKHHGLIAGSTGSGKSNTSGSVVKGASNLGFCTIIYDHKPDYQDMELPNNKGEQVYFKGMQDVHYFYIGDPRKNQSEHPITVPACEFDPAVLANTICWKPNESNAADTLESLLDHYAHQRLDRPSSGPWSIQDFREWLPETSDELRDREGITVHTKTYQAMISRLDRRNRIPVWARGRGSSGSGSGFFSDKGEEIIFNLQNIIKPGRVIVVRIGSNAGGGRDYGLFLSYILKAVYRLREAGSLPCEVLHLIDEAQDIFDADSGLTDAIGGMLDENIRKGRSRGIGFMIGVQSGDSVPEKIRNNLNSQFIHRHNNHTQARKAMPRATDAQTAMTDTFGPGECLAYIFGSNAVVHCKMRQSPFLLT